MKPISAPLITPDTIGFDFDGVIADIGEAFLRLACEKHGYCSCSLEEITSFQVETCIDIPEKVVRTIFDDILADSLATGLRPLPGAVEILERLGRHSPLIIITARSLAEPVADWLDHHLSEELCRSIDLVAMHDHDRKVEFIRQRKLHYFVDDRAETCAQIEEARLSPLLFRQPWNSSWTNFTTVDDWRHLARLIAWQTGTADTENQSDHGGMVCNAPIATGK